MSSAQSVLVLSTDFLYTEGAKAYFNNSSNYDSIEIAHEFVDFERYTKSLDPKLIIVDLSSDIFKIEKVIAFVGFTTQSKILLMGGVLSESEFKQLRQWGVHAICLKSSKKEELDNCIAALEKDEFYLGKDVVQKKEGGNLENDIFTRLNVSEREKEIIKLIAEGFINKEIADQLFLSTHTVNTHRKNIMQKLNINNTAGIVLFAVQQKIVTPSEFLFH